MTTARLTWVVLDRLVPSGDEDRARSALIARDPELASLVARGDLSQDEAIETLRRRQVSPRAGDRAALRAVSALLVLSLLLIAWLVTALLH